MGSRFAMTLCLGLAAVPVFAQDDLAARKVVAAEYLGLSIETMDLDAVAAQVAGVVLAQIEQQQPDLYAQKAARLNDLVTGAMAQNLREGMIGLDDDMAQAFSLAELTALRDFYASPVGRSVMGKMPAFMAAAMPRIMQGSTTSSTLMQQLKAEGLDVR